jgi:formyltetrahydrofolate deformylase
MQKRYILTLSCKDTHGIVAAVSGFLAQSGGFIIESAQFGDFSTGRFFMRTEFDASHDAPTIRKEFTPLAEKFAMEWSLCDLQKKPRLLILVSKEGHCLNDLLHRYRTGGLGVEIPAVASNHLTLKQMVDWNDIPFMHLPITPETKQSQEQELLKIIEEHQIDLVVLARYMQILSPDLCNALRGRAINIHHSFLPSFKGAKPYHQAFTRGVKLIGATAHFVTEDLDEGPIIEQEVARVDHTQKPEDLVAIGQDSECIVLARALKYWTEHRVLLNGNKTVIFR